MRVSALPDAKAQLGYSAWRRYLQGNGKRSAAPTEEGCSRHGEGRGGELHWVMPCGPAAPSSSAPVAGSPFYFSSGCVILSMLLASNLLMLWPVLSVDQLQSQSGTQCSCPRCGVTADWCVCAGPCVTVTQRCHAQHQVPCFAFQLVCCLPSLPKVSGLC